MIKITKVFKASLKSNGLVNQNLHKIFDLREKVNF